MHRILPFLLVCTLFFACRPDQPSQQLLVHATITDLKGTPIKEVASGESILINSSELAELFPNGIPANQAKLFFNDVPAAFQQAGPGSIGAKVPLMLMVNYTTLRIRIQINNFPINIIEFIIYRPRVTAEVLAGNDGTFQMPAEMTIDAAGNLYLIDQRTGHDVIYRVTPTGATSLFAGGKNEFGRLVGIGINNTTSNIYVSDATAQQVKWFNLSSPSTVNVLAGSGSAGNADGTGIAASFRFGPEMVNSFTTNEKGQGLTIDASGNIFVGEVYGTGSGGLESQIRRITPAGETTTVPGSRITMIMDGDAPHPPAGITIQQPTNEVVYIGGASSFFQGIARISTTGTMTRIAGRVSTESFTDGTGTAATFTFPKALSYFNGYFHIADGSNGAYRRMTAGGEVITIAGVGHMETPTFCGGGPCAGVSPVTASYIFPSIFDGNPQKFRDAAHAIKLDQVGGIAVRTNGLIYLTDYGTNFKCVWRIRIE